MVGPHRKGLRNSRWNKAEASSIHSSASGIHRRPREGRDRTRQHAVSHRDRAVAILVLTLAFLLIASQFLLSPFDHDSDIESYLQRGRNMTQVLKNSPEETRKAIHNTNGIASLAGSGAISCQDARNKVLGGEWHDPNQGRLFARWLVSDPPFYVSVHNHSYDFVRWKSIFETGKYYEDLVHSRFLEILKDKPSSLVLDVGANIGYYTLLSAALGHQVIGFEINPPNLLRICESLQLNGWQDSDNVAIFQRGVSNVHGAALQVFVPRNPGQAYMKELDKEATVNETSTHHAFTTTVTLDQFAQERGWFVKPSLSVSILKLDVEGKEPQIIEGAKQLLRSGIVENVLTEFRRLSRQTIQEAISTLFETGHTLVHEEKGKVGQDEARRILKDLEKQLYGKGTNVDLWFQRV